MWCLSLSPFRRVLILNLTRRFKTSDKTAIDGALYRCKKDGWNKAKMTKI